MGESETAAPDPLAESPRADEVAALVCTVVLTAADEQRVRFADGLTELMQEAGLSVEDGQLGDANVLQALQDDEGLDEKHAEVLDRLLLRALAQAPPADGEETSRLVEQLMWLSAHSPLNPLWRLDAAAQKRLWPAVAKRLSALDGAAGGRAEALPAAMALARSRLPVAQKVREGLLDSLSDPMLRLAVAVALEEPDQAPSFDADSPEPATALDGQLVPAPLNSVALVLQALSGILLLRYLWRFISKVLLRCRQPAKLRVSDQGLELESRFQLVGRTLRTRQEKIPAENLARAVREVRFARAPLYAGLIALAVGSYVGVSFMTEGGRGGSPSLLLLGIGVFGAGVIADFLLSNLWSSRPGQIRLVFTPRRGRSFALSTSDSAGAVAALRRLR